MNRKKKKKKKKKTKNTKNPYPGFSNIFKETFSVLPWYEISRIQNMGSLKSA